MCDIHVIGCQLPAVRVVRLHDRGLSVQLLHAPRPESLDDVGVSVNIGIIVANGEFEIPDLDEYQQDHQHEKAANRRNFQAFQQ